MIAEKLCRPLTAVRQKAYDIGMKTDTYQYWSDEDLKRLTKLYSHTSTKDLSEQLDRSEGSIKTKARQLGLKKSKSYLRTIKTGPRKKGK
jgi:transcriptional regulator of aromatic amino acid metabolism